MYNVKCTASILRHTYLTNKFRIQVQKLDKLKAVRKRNSLCYVQWVECQLLSNSSVMLDLKYSNILTETKIHILYA